MSLLGNLIKTVFQRKLFALYSHHIKHHYWFYFPFLPWENCLSLPQFDWWQKFFNWKWSGILLNFSYIFDKFCLSDVIRSILIKYLIKFLWKYLSFFLILFQPIFSHHYLTRINHDKEKYYYIQFIVQIF
jgi:hypothetical protein